MMVLIVFGLLIGTAFAQHANQGIFDQTAHNLFHDSDTNGDGFLTLDELIANFHKYDSNGNGKVSRHEYTEYVCHSAPELYVLSHYLYDMYDSNHDHTLDEPDYRIFFPKMDANGDGQVDFNEYATFGQQTFDNYANHETHHEIHFHGHSKCH